MTGKAYNPFMFTNKKKTYFGVAAFVTGLVSGLSLAGNFIAANLNISPGTFSQLNNLTALFFCILTPLTFVFGVLGHTRKNDSKTLSRVALALVGIPFLFMFVKFVYSFIK
jgi:surface polysaccharide O-acyltransferase-like enzyme